MYIPSGSPELLDKRFCEEYPKLGIIPTSGSGSYWGDGDGRPKSIRYDEIQWGMEGKVRISSRHKTLKPYAAEWVKALTQLRKRNASAIRIFVVYSTDKRDFSVSLPLEDVEQLRAHGITVEGEDHAISSGGEAYPFLLLDEFEWDDVYAQL